MPYLYPSSLLQQWLSLRVTMSWENLHFCLRFRFRYCLLTVPRRHEHQAHWSWASLSTHRKFHSSMPTVYTEVQRLVFFWFNQVFYAWKRSWAGSKPARCHVSGTQWPERPAFTSLRWHIQLLTWITLLSGTITCAMSLFFFLMESCSHEVSSDHMLPGL